MKMENYANNLCHRNGIWYDAMLSSNMSRYSLNGWSFRHGYGKKLWRYDALETCIIIIIIACQIDRAQMKQIIEQ